MAFDTVMNLNASGAGSLAKTLANASAGDIIYFASNL
jgi:hypothetical protein